jgi:hypothetical protein
MTPQSTTRSIISLSKAMNLILSLTEGNHIRYSSVISADGPNDKPLN